MVVLSLSLGYFVTVIRYCINENTLVLSTLCPVSSQRARCSDMLITSLGIYLLISDECR